MVKNFCLGIMFSSLLISASYERNYHHSKASLLTDQWWLKLKFPNQ